MKYQIYASKPCAVRGPVASTMNKTRLSGFDSALKRWFALSDTGVITERYIDIKYEFDSNKIDWIYPIGFKNTISNILNGEILFSS